MVVFKYNLSMTELRYLLIIAQRFFMGLLLFVMLTSCASVGPDYQPPVVEVPARWSAAVPDDITNGSMDREGISLWWGNLNDTVLTGLIERALASNNDMKTAIARVREARARLGINKDSLYPTLEATGSARFTDSETQTGSVTTQQDNQSRSIGLDASWEIDIFGGTRRSIEAAEADLSALDEGLRDVRVTLTAEVALTFIKIREYQQRIVIAEKNISALQEEYEMIRIKRKTGLISQLEMSQITETLATTQAQLPSLNSALNESLNSIAILLGMPPGSLDHELSAPGPVPSASVGIAVGVPADLLRRRPDIRRAERELAAETARVGVAVSDLYPKLSLSGSFVYEELRSDSGGSSATTKSRTLGFGPSVRLPLLGRDAIRRNIDIQDARQEQALIAYEQTVLLALGEVENAMSSYGGAERKVDLLQQSVEASQEIYSLKNSLYMAGLDDFESLLTAGKSLFSLQDRLALAEAAVASDLIRIYKALGGGW